VDGHTIVNQPIITISQKWLVKILDNKRSTHAFFGSKVLLVEGETDRYLYRAILAEIEEKIKKGLTQDITVLDISEKEKVKEWRDLFESFGLKVFFLADLDCSFQLFYPIETAYKINTEALANQFIIAHPDVSAKIESEYPGGNFILKLGDLELYLGTHQKGISQIIEFCKNNLSAYLGNGSDAKVKEIKTIMAIVTGESEASF
jgi:predicted ATP-dependent endonuclease of OLD family